MAASTRPGTIAGPKASDKAEAGMRSEDQKLGWGPMQKLVRGPVMQNRSNQSKTAAAEEQGTSQPCDEARLLPMYPSGWGQMASRVPQYGETEKETGRGPKEQPKSQVRYQV